MEMNGNLNIFYKEFKKYFRELVNCIDDKIEKFDKSKIAQNIFNQIFFIHFLCNKGIIKGNGMKISGEHFFSQKIMNNGSLLNNLKKFFSLFSKTKNIGICIGDIHITCSLLNINFFSISNMETNLKISPSKQYWNDFFSFLNKFDWYIGDEGRKIKNSDDRNKIITPEILGYLHERLIFEREKKKKGIYYTPKAITEYICKRTIYSKILDKLNINGELIFQINEILENEKNKGIIKEILDQLDEIKILDPSCGTGAFLITIANVLLELITVLNKKMMILKDESDIKWQIINKNLHGVDTSPRALEIAKLRLYLWLISSYPIDNKSGVLPNIEYNFRVGNSLLGINHEELMIEPTFSLKGILEPFFKRIIDIADPKIIISISEAITRLETNDFISKIKAYQILKETCLNGSQEVIMLLKQIIMIIYEYLNKEINTYYAQLINNNFKDKEIHFEREEIIRHQPFHWRFEFGSIINEGGFDIIIGNPPYVFTRGMNFGKFERIFYKKNYLKDYKTLARGRAKQSGKLNIFSLFLIRSLELLKTGGLLGFILPNTILRTSTNDIIRQYILNHSFIEEIIDLGGSVFRGVTTSAIIMILRNDIHLKDEETLIKYDVKDLVKREYYYHKLNQDNFRDNVICCYNIHVDEHFMRVFKNMKINTFDLGDITSEIIEGLVTRKNDDLFTKDPKIKGVKKLIRGKNIDRYKMNWPEGQFIIYDPSRLHRARTRNIHEAPEKLILQRIGGGLYPLRATYDNEQYYFFASTNAIILQNSPVINNITYNIKYILAILNSTLINGYYLLNFSNHSELTVNITKTFIETIPIKMVPEKIQKLVSNIVDYILYLNKFHQIETEMIEYFDKTILDNVIYEIYLENDFHLNILNDISSYLKSIEISMEKPNYLGEIKDIYRNMKNDLKFQEKIKKLSNYSVTMMFKRLFQTRLEIFNLNV